jgi:hypothetical protein
MTPADNHIIVNPNEHFRDLSTRSKRISDAHAHQSSLVDGFLAT